jgi:5-dehydro-2-deoxygluconokinase
VPPADLQTCPKYLDGTATNAAVQAARLGSKTALMTNVEDDPLGPFVRQALARAVWMPVSAHPALRTPIVFCEVYPPDRFRLLSYREPKAPDLNL